MNTIDGLGIKCTRDLYFEENIIVQQPIFKDGEEARYIHKLVASIAPGNNFVGGPAAGLYNDRKLFTIFENEGDKVPQKVVEVTMSAYKYDDFSDGMQNCQKYIIFVVVNTSVISQTPEGRLVKYNSSVEMWDVSRNDFVEYLSKAKERFEELSSLMAKDINA